MSDSTTRFTSRVANYVRFRPGYPAGLLDLLRDDCGLSSVSIVADVGSGTGILSELFLGNGNDVFCVEPNDAMRQAAEVQLGAQPRFHSINGTAEATTLPAAFADFVVAGQAFHWFDREKSRAEFARILKPLGWVVLVWNERSLVSSPFAVDYEQLLLEFSTDYEAVVKRSPSEEVLRQFFGGGFTARTLVNSQRFDFESLLGRLMSSSYAPEAGHEKHEPMVRTLREIFDRHQVNNEVKFDYDTNLYYGHL